jgi:hypothetical protein
MPIINYGPKVSTGVTTLMAVHGDDDPAKAAGVAASAFHALYEHAEHALVFAGGAALLGSKRPLFWAIVGAVGSGLFKRY